MPHRPRDEIVEQWGKLLVKHGFIIDEDLKGRNVRKRYKYDHIKEHWIPVAGDYDPEDALQEFAEEVSIATPNKGYWTEYIPTSYPAPLKRYHIAYEAYNLSIEDTYFWLIDEMREQQMFTRAEKIRDIFTATENSSFFGASQQRLGIQQDRVQQYLATIGKMIKDLFQLVRELRILDEKLVPRKEWKQSKSADMTLKGEFIDLVENRGGQTNVSSVYGLAQQLGYASLPDLFFNTHIHDAKDVDRICDRLNFNKNLLSVLKRKLYQFITWKVKTDHELEQRRTFTLKYLRQHWDVIDMYMAWVKPYLRHIARLQMNDDRLDEPDLIGAFEQSYIETEVLFSRPTQKSRSKFEVAILTIDFRTRPQMNYSQEYSHRGPLHTGRAEIYLRGYIWHKDTIKQYMRYRREEDLYMLGVIDKSVQNAMEALGDELEQYLAEAGEPKYKEKIEKQRKKEEAFAKSGGPNPLTGIFEPFTGLFSGFGEMFSFGFNFGGKKQPSAPPYPPVPRPGVSAGNLPHSLYQAQKNYKKKHNMLSWG